MDNFRAVLCNVLERRKRGSKVSEREQDQTWGDLCTRLNTGLLLPATES